MRYEVTRTGIPNNATVSVGSHLLAVMWLDAGPPTEARIAVLPERPEEGAEDSYHVVTVGDTFPIGAETWRFESVHHLPGDRFTVVVERVDPPVPRDIRRFGEASEEQIAAVEAELGRALPPAYRAWLASTNGAQPIGDHWVPGLFFTLFKERPLLGVHSEYPPFDLVQADRQYRQAWLPEDYVVIGVPSGGLLAVRCTEPGIDNVVFLSESVTTGSPSDEDMRARASHLVTVAVDIDDFLPRLVMIEAESGEPRSGQPG